MPFESSIPDRIIWVSPGGDDGNSGSRDAPLQSIQLAIDRAVPGTAIMLLPGDYSGSFEFEKIEGTGDKPIWLAAADGPGTVTVTAPSSSDTIITIQGEDNIIIRDLTLVGGYDGISVNQSGQNFTDLVNNIVIEGNTIIGAAHDGIKVGQTSNVLVYNNTVNGAGEQGIDCLGVTNAVIDGNEIMNVTGSSGMFVKGGSSDVLIANNYIHDVTGDGLLVGGWTDPEFFLPGTDYEAKNVVVTGNVVEDAAKRPLTVRGAQDVDIHDNFFGTMETNESVLLISTGSTELSPPPPSMRVSIHDNVFDRSKNFANIDPSSVDISIVENVKDGVIEGDMRPFPPEPSPALSEALPDSLLDAPVWATTARATTNITAGSGNQTLTGTSGNDNLSGGAGDDVTIGGSGDDSHSVGSSRDQVVENAGEGIDTAVVYIKSYTLTANVENLRVNYASNGGTYKGNELDNILKGGVGSETFTGGLGDDLFLPSAGNDRIADFAAGPGNGDRIDLRSFTTFVGLDDVLAHATEAGADTVIDLGSGNSLTLVNVAPAALAEDDFLFTTVAPPPIVNQPPTDILLSNDVVAEGVGVGAVVGGLSAADPDDGESFTFTLVDDADGSFAIDGNNLVVAGPLDYETAPSRDAIVRVTDSAGNAFEKSLTVNLTNEAPSLPVDADDVANEISENTVTGAAVGIVASSGDIGGGAVAYALVDDAGGRFAIDAATGQVTVADASLIDYETAAEHTITVQASDASGATSTSSLTIDVVNEAPTPPEDLDDGPNHVQEGAATGTAVGLAAFAADINGGAVAYSLLDDAGGRFAIDVDTGLVTVADGSLIDFETAAEHLIVVQAADATGGASTASFTIGVGNSPPTAPDDADDAPNMVAEGAEDGAAVGIAVVSSEASSAFVTYSLLDDAGGRFAIDATTGLVTVADGSLLDHETAAEHTIVVQASDASGAASTASFTIGVANEAPIVPEDLDEALNQVAEGAASGTAVGLAVSSADVNGGMVAYSLLDDAGGRFAIDAATGLVTIADGSLLDYETATGLTVVVQASDPSGASRTASFTIAVNDVSGVTVTGTNVADTVDATSTVSLKPLPTEEADVISTNGGDDHISALGGGDTINGGSGADTMIGGLGNDTYYVDNAGDVLVEHDGEGIDQVMSSIGFTLGAYFENLTLTGSNGSSATGNALDNVIRGNDSSNLLAGLSGADTLIGGLGMDKASYAASATGVNVSLATGLAFGGDAEGDTFSNVEGLIGSTFDDVIEGDGGKNVLVGGDGIDTLSYEHASGDITVSLNKTSGQLTGAGNDTISGFENVTGSNFADRLTGTTGANTLSGLGGNDTLIGDAGDDQLVGGAGDDSLTGGAGLDAFAFDFASEGFDTIADFVSGSDYLQISATGFGGGLSAGDLATLVTVADLSAASGGDGGYFIFDNAGDNAGTVYWDETGGTSDDAQAFARLATGTSLLPSDFHVV